MTYTQHGHRIPSSPMDDGPAQSVVQCGGPENCVVCAGDVDKFIEMVSPGRDEMPTFAEEAPAQVPPWLSHVAASNTMTRAIELVANLINQRLEKTDPTPDFSVYLVWFSYTLGNWKALASSTLSDGRYYEITHDKVKGQTYVDTYVKIDNIAIPDEDAPAINTPSLSDW